MSPPDSEPDDNDLVRMVQGGDRERFSLLIGRHQRAVFGLGLGFFKNREDSADFTQDVFLKAFRSLSSFQGRSKFSTWLYRIAYNTAINALKRRKEYASLAEDAELPDYDDPERQALGEATRAAVLSAVKDLPERYRICVDLYYFFGVSYPDIETITGFPVNTIKSHVFRAKSILRETLKNDS